MKMVLLPMDVTGTIRIACLLTLLIMMVSGHVSEDQLARQDMLCETYEVREPVHGRHHSDADSDHENCMKELRKLAAVYARAKATDAGMTLKDWLVKNGQRGSYMDESYRIEVRGGPNNSLRFVSVFLDPDDDPIRQPPKGQDPINERFMALKNRQLAR